MPAWTKVLSDARKLGVAILGGAAQIVATGVLPDEYEPWGLVVIAIATAAGVYGVENKPAAPKAA